MKDKGLLWVASRYGQIYPAFPVLGNADIQAGDNKRSWVRNFAPDGVAQTAPFRIGDNWDSTQSP